MSYRYGLEEEVNHNRQQFLTAVGVEASPLAQMSLVHGTTVTKVVSQKAATFPQTDALITNLSGVALWLLTGDCAPVFFCDPVKKVIALAHCGYAGTIGKLPLKILARLISDYNCSVADIRVAFGPTIEKCCYSKDLLLLPEWKNFSHSKNGQNYLDLNGFSVHELQSVGVPKKNIDYTPLCTKDNCRIFFSYRDEKDNLTAVGRFASVLQLTDALWSTN